jgi:predicted nucleotidyltransferase
LLDSFISSQTRLKLLLRLFLNPASRAYLRGMAEEFHQSTNAIRIELNRFEEAGMLVSENQGNKKIYRANTDHPLYPDIRNILMKYVGLDQVLKEVIERLGRLEKVYLTGDYASGKDSGIIDLIFVGKMDKSYLVKLIDKAEKLIHRKIRFLSYDVDEWKQNHRSISDREKFLLLWEKE